MNDEKKSVIEELEDLRRQQDEQRENDIIQRTIGALLAIEKKSIYGSLRGKPKMMDKIILGELKHYKEYENASKED